MERGKKTFNNCEKVGRDGQQTPQKQSRLDELLAALNEDLEARLKSHCDAEDSFKFTPRPAREKNVPASCHRPCNWPQFSSPEREAWNNYEHTGNRVSGSIIFSTIRN
jgi:hypothetical protein